MIRTGSSWSGLREDWTGARLTTRLPADVMEWKYRKLLSNVGNAVQALLGQQPGDGRHRAGRPGGRSRGARRRRDRATPATRRSRRRGRSASPCTRCPGLPEFLGGSTWQSLTRGTGNVETDYLNGELVLIARQHGRSAPLNSRLASLVRQAARPTSTPPGAMSNAELAARLGLDQ